MSYLQEQIDIEEFFLTEWAETPVVLENGTAIEADEWVRLTVLNGRSKQVTMGDDPAFRHYGSVVVQIFTKLDAGAGRARELADLIHTLFLNKTLGTLRFSVPQVQKGPPSTEWFQLNVSTDFYRGF